MSHTQDQESEPNLDFIFCETCGSCEMERGKKFTFCIGCRTIYYCSWECESADLLNHHRLCRELFRFNFAASPHTIQVLHHAEQLRRRTADFDTLYYLTTKWGGMKDIEISGPYRCIPAAAFAVFSDAQRYTQRLVIRCLVDGSLFKGNHIHWMPYVHCGNVASCRFLTEENLHVKASLPCDVWVVLVKMTHPTPSKDSRKDGHDNRDPLLSLASPLIGTFLSARTALDKARQVTKQVAETLTSGVAIDSETKPGVARVFRLREGHRVAMTCTVRKLGMRAGREMAKVVIGSPHFEKGGVTARQRLAVERQEIMRRYQQRIAQYLSQGLEVSLEVQRAVFNEVAGSL